MNSPQAPSTSVWAREGVRSSFADGTVQVLGLPVELDGRLSIHPVTARGTAFLNVVLLREETGALLIDTGFTTHLDEVTAWLDDTLDGARLSVFPLRQSEFDSVANVQALVSRYPVERVYGAQGQGFPWFDFRSEGYDSPWTGAARFEKVPAVGSLEVAPARELEVLLPELMLLTSHWVLDTVSGTLLASDVFGHVRDCAIQLDCGAADPTAIRESLVGNRYWWLPGARTDGIAAWLREFFARHEIRRIIPAHGAILEGADVVAEHVEVLCGVIERLGTESPPTPPAVPVRRCAPVAAAPVGPPTGTLPRELGPGLSWLGACLEQRYQGRTYHSYNSIYVVSGTERSMIVEGGFPGDLDVLERQLDDLLAAGLPPVEYLFATHCETPHSSAFGRFLRRFPDAVAVGGVHDLHFVFPDYADRIRVPGPEGVRIDLGDREFWSVPAVIRDLRPTYWGFESGGATLFPGDGFSFSHYHTDGHCGLVSEEAGSLDVPDMTALFAELALNWTRYVDLEPYVTALEQLLDDLGVAVVAPSHGLPITDPAATVPQVVEGLRLGARH